MTNDDRYLWLRKNCPQEILSEVFGIDSANIRSQAVVGTLLDTTIDDQITRDKDDE